MQNRDSVKKDTLYKLCYVRDGVMYFTDNFENQMGDDWDDAPYEYNAEPPYEIIDWLPDNTHRGNIRYIAFIDVDVTKPCDYGINSPFSVEDINKGAVPWLFNNKAKALKGGATMNEAKGWLKKAGAKWGELK